MTTDRLDAILERLGAVLEKTDDDDVRRDVREVQQLVVGVKADLADERRSKRARPRESGRTEED